MCQVGEHTKKRQSCNTELEDLIDCCTSYGGRYFDHGAQLLDGTEPMALLLSHNSSLTGAPIVLLHAAIVLRRMGMRPLLVSPMDGPLRTEALVHGIATLFIPFERHPELVMDACYAASFVVASTIESCAVVDCLNGTGVPVLWWIHEAEECYSPWWEDLLPSRLYPNVVVMAGGPVARKSLLARRPNYAAGELLFALPDRASEAERIRGTSSLVDNRAGKKLFVLIATLEPRKGQDILLDAIRKLPHDVAESCHFVFVGPRRDRKTAKMVRSAARKNSRHLTYVTQIPYKDLSRVYAEADCVICASRSEPMGATMSEACMFSKPTICSDSAGMARFLSAYDAGLVFKTQSADELAACICRVCRMDTKALNKMEARARKLYESNFTEEVFERHMSLIIERASCGSLAFGANRDESKEKMRELSCKMATSHGRLFRQECRPRWAKVLYNVTRWTLLSCVLPVRYRVLARRM